MAISITDALDGVVQLYSGAWWPWVATTATLVIFVSRRAIWYSAFSKKVLDTPTSGNAAAPITFYTVKRIGGMAVTPCSPFVAKLDAFFRLSNIPVIRKDADPMKAPKGKMPYIDHDGVRIGDSSLIINYCTNTWLSGTPAEKFDAQASSSSSKSKVRAGSSAASTSAAVSTVGVSGASAAGSSSAGPFVPWCRLTPAQQATSTAVQRIVEDHLYWGMVYYRWVRAHGDSAVENWKATVNGIFGRTWIATIIATMVRPKVQANSFAQGLTRHSDTDINGLLLRDLQALSSFLGDKEWFTDAGGPTECDCAAFGLLDNIMYGTHKTAPTTWLLQDPQFANLKKYTDKMRQLLYPEELEKVLNRHAGKDRTDKSE